MRRSPWPPHPAPWPGMGQPQPVGAPKVVTIKESKNQTACCVSVPGIAGKPQITDRTYPVQPGAVRGDDVTRQFVGTIKHGAGFDRQARRAGSVHHVVHRGQRGNREGALGDEK